MQVQFIHQISNSHINATLTINNHIAYLIMNMTPHMKDVISLLLQISQLSLQIQCLFHHKCFILNRILNTIITSILKQRHFLLITNLLIDHNLTMFFHNHTSFVYTLRSNMTNFKTIKAFYVIIIRYKF
jgi:hypothetical protein